MKPIIDALNFPHPFAPTVSHPTRELKQKHLRSRRPVLCVRAELSPLSV
jgi:hypothetical protein